MIVDKYFNSKIQHQIHQKRIEHIYGIADQFVTYFLPQSASWILSMMYKQSKSDTSGDVLIRDLRYLGSVVNQCFSSLGLIVQLGGVWANTRGHLERVATLVESLEQTSIKSKSTTTLSPSIIQLINADIVPPSGDKVLVHHLNLTIDASIEKGIMVTGPSGSGKSTVLKCMNGLMPPADGSVVSTPSAIHYIPTKPYLAEGCLADQITYPETADKDKDYVRIMDALRLVRVAYLDERDGGIFGSISDSWDTKLSLGEQQRIAVARLLVAGGPRSFNFAFLDECTSAVALDGEEEMYRAISSKGLCCITASQKPWLLQFHNRIVQLSEDSTYDVSDVPATEDVQQSEQPRLPEVVYQDARQKSMHVTFDEPPEIPNEINGVVEETNRSPSTNSKRKTKGRK
jgi:ABC-type uncharacterized transport system fused permease/ATPase subunit